MSGRIEKDSQYFLDDAVIFANPYISNKQHLDNARFYYDLQDWNDTYHFGNVPVDILNRRSRYLVTYDEGFNDWIIVNERRLDKNADSERGPLTVRITPIARYKDPNDAINAMKAFNKVGYHTRNPFFLRQTIISYLDKEIGLNESILGIMSIFGLNKHPEFQRLTTEAVAYGIKNGDPDLLVGYMTKIHQYKDRYPDSLFRLYSDMYDVFVKFNFFKDKKYHPEDLEEVDLENECRTFLTLITPYIHQSLEAGR